MELPRRRRRRELCADRHKAAKLSIWPLYIGRLAAPPRRVGEQVVKRRLARRSIDKPHCGAELVADCRLARSNTRFVPKRNDAASRAARSGPIAGFASCSLRRRNRQSGKAGRRTASSNALRDAQLELETAAKARHMRQVTLCAHICAQSDRLAGPHNATL